MNKEASKLYDEFFDKWINIFVPDEGDNRLECEYALHKFIEALQEDKWISVEKLPNCFESGDWDGLRSEEIQVLLKNGRITTAYLYSGKMDGSEFNDWYDVFFEWGLDTVTHWQPLPKPPKDR